MNEPQTNPDERVLRPWYRKELLLFIIGAIGLAFIMVAISMALYTSSGASLLDASRPGFKTVQKEVDQSDSFEAFSASGEVDKGTLEYFEKLFQKQVQPVIGSEVFDSTALEDHALGIDEAPAAQ